MSDLEKVFLKVFSATSDVPKDVIGEFAVFTNEIEDFKNIREKPTRIGYLTDVYPLGFENRFVCNSGSRFRYCLLDKNIYNLPKFVPFYEFKQDPYSWYVFDHKKIEIEEKSSGKTFNLEGLNYEIENGELFITLGLKLSVKDWFEKYNLIINNKKVPFGTRALKEEM